MKDCDKCYLYGECDHQGAYKRKDGLWCYEPVPKMIDKLIELRADLSVKDEFLVEVYEALDFENLSSDFVKGMRHGLIHCLILIDDLIKNKGT